METDDMRYLFDEKAAVSVCDALELAPGITAIIGSGGKTSLMMCMAYELAHTAHTAPRVIVTTSTHIRPVEGIPLVNDAAALEDALALTSPVCCASLAPEGKLGAPALPWDALRSAAEYVFVEADGSRRLPLKAHASHEPPIPGGARVIAVLGASGFNKTIAQAAHRPELYAAALGVGVDEVVTPELAARAFLMRFPGDTVVINQADTNADIELCARFAAAYGAGTVIAAALRDARRVKRIWRDAQCLY